MNVAVLRERAGLSITETEEDAGNIQAVLKAKRGQIP